MICSSSSPSFTLPAAMICGEKMRCAHSGNSRVLRHSNLLTSCPNHSIRGCEAKPVDEKSWKHPVILFFPATTSNPNIGAVFSMCGNTQQCIIHKPLDSRESTTPIFARRYVSLVQLRLDQFTFGSTYSSFSICCPVSENLLT